MDNPLTVSVVVTLIGMAVVFLAMALIYASMQLLTALAKDRGQPTSAPPQATTDYREDRRASDMDRLRIAAITVAVARARSMAEMGSNSRPAGSSTTPWGDYYRHRQLGSRGPGRIGS